MNNHQRTALALYRIGLMPARECFHAMFDRWRTDRDRLPVATVTEQPSDERY